MKTLGLSNGKGSAVKSLTTRKSKLRLQFFMRKVVYRSFQAGIGGSMLHFHKGPGEATKRKHFTTWSPKGIQLRCACYTHMAIRMPTPTT